VEVEDAHVFELLIDDGDDLDVFGFLAFASFEAADAADVEFDFDACFGGGVEGVDHVDVFKRVHLGHDAGFFPFEGAGGFFFDEVDEGAFDLGGGGDEGSEVFELGAAGDGIEEDGGITSVFRAAGEVGDVGVKARGDLVIVSGGEVDVAFEVAVFIADDEGDFGVSFESFDAVENLGASATEFFGTVEVVGFVEAGFEFDEGGDLLAGFGGVDEGVDDLRIFGSAVEGLLDR